MTNCRMEGSSDCGSNWVCGVSPDSEEGGSRVSRMGQDRTGQDRLLRCVCSSALTTYPSVKLCERFVISCIQSERPSASASGSNLFDCILKVVILTSTVN